ncbi:MAG TPA: cytochrome c family protein [Rhizomicrobium sp.]|nr:cytochrome c family protein [Rhizomicrobium sp.]
MDSFEWNKIIGAVLGTVMFVVILKIATEAIFDVPPPAKAGYIVEGVQEAATGGGTAAPVEEALPDWGTALPKADLAAGKDVSTRCEQCHDLSKGGPDKIGPNLWGIVGRARASRASFSYSGAMMSSHDVWDFDKLFRYLKSPQSVVPGTKMTFAGLPSAAQRINLLAYLRTLSDSPMAIPAPKPAAAAPAAGTAAPAGPSTMKGGATGSATTTPTGKPATPPATPTTGVNNPPKK